MTRVRVTVYTDHGAFVREHEVEDFIYNAAREPLDMPTRDADSFSRYLCTDTYTIERVTKSRRILIKVLSQAIAEELATIISANDTVMGYPKERSS